MFNVPQFIDVEDKIAGPLTWRQLLWMIGLGAVLLVLFNTVEKSLFIVIAVPVVLLFVALAFYRPHNQPLIVYVAYAFTFLFRPKLALWERPVSKLPKKVVEPTVKPDILPKEKRVTLEELRRLANIVDQHGRI